MWHVGWVCRPSEWNKIDSEGKKNGGVVVWSMRDMGTLCVGRSLYYVSI